MVDKLKFEFNGSFQCRLSTDPAPATASPKNPATDPGWTFAYGETKFDRIIRLSSPVSLRSALVDPWQDTKVSKVWIDTGSGLRVNTSTGLDGQPFPWAMPFSIPLQGRAPQKKHYCTLPLV
jgi:hypothetical protein